ncbi:MAG TPA: molybdenum cofactor biosynthesis protein B [Candidatus Dormibacteraeota bacterium]|nr:molybdenum cofactor biosynthesis protein B [Candidatus Dormibacteraeota bacterium]
MGHREHRLQGPASVPCAVLTVSDTRHESTDASGALILRTLRGAGHAVVDYRILKDDPRRIVSHLRALAKRARARVVLLTGGTGVGVRDSTFEAVSGLLDKRLDGFGEIFRALSYREIGSAAMLSRAVAGTYRGMVLFSMPGSEAAVRLAMTKLILPELPHVAGLVGKETRRSRNVHAR